MRAMLPAFIAETSPCGFGILGSHCCRRRFCHQEFTTPNADCKVVVTATGEPPDSAWAGRRGRVDAALLDECAPGGVGARSCDVFICGPRPFEDSCRAALQMLGLSKAHIFSESFETTDLNH